jgi:hypothetical protein
LGTLASEVDQVGISSSEEGKKRKFSGRKTWIRDKRTLYQTPPTVFLVRDPLKKPQTRGRPTAVTGLRGISKSIENIVQNNCLGGGRERDVQDNLSVTMFG